MQNPDNIMNAWTQTSRGSHIGTGMPRNIFSAGLR